MYNCGIEYIKEAIPLSLRNKCMDFMRDNLNKNIWCTNHAWKDELNVVTDRVSILNLTEEIKNTIHNSLIEKTSVLNGLKPIASSLYVWEMGSCIGWHDDGAYAAGSTVYLSVADRDYGGAFIWKNPDNPEEPYHCIFPEERSAIINFKKADHCVSMIYPRSPKWRITLQTFYV